MARRVTDKSAQKSIFTNEHVPDRLCKSEPFPRVARTVKEMRDLLAEYPDELPVECGFGAVQLAWANIGHDSERLLVDEASDWEDDDE